jgi:glycosyltransferase involved in cell wall biosynthesis
MMEISKPAQFAIIIPACDEEACIGPVLDELQSALDPEKFVVAVGVNGSSDRTAAIARARGAWVSETPRRGYGYGCQSAIDLLANVLPPVRAYIFLAGDGASDPQDVRKLVDAYEQGYTFVLGARTAQPSNWRTMRVSHVIANFAVALWCGLLAGRWFKDLAPVRLIERNLFEAIAPREMTFGWTIEAQIAAAKLGAAICEVPASERARLA